MTVSVFNAFHAIIIGIGTFAIVSVLIEDHLKPILRNKKFSYPCISGIKLLCSLSTAALVILIVIWGSSI